ncbi:type II secretion system F family protein [Blastococcus saxobsidens]|uniref:Flp pilus assembly protein n=1 Tax=Blastococcus saxobsidens (strain DD2) TaxID=1146883 RepID=H6RRU3_BLASD|nr:type II secretion system F family protein [Blastococcus saxobsidens]CCG02937.1 Flp pilus assembly protein [Blastococcus saxobsidens DD2]
MSGTLALLLGAGAATGALLLAVVALVPPAARVPLARLDPSVPPAPTLLTRMTDQAQGGVEQVLVRRGWVSGVAGALAAAGVRFGAAEFGLLVAAGSIVAGAVGLLLANLVVALLFAVVVPVLARVLLGVLAGRRRAAFADQFSDSLQLMASSLRAGHSLLRAIDSVATEAPAPTSEEFARIVNETRVGRDLDTALREVADRMGSEDFAWVAQAIAIQRTVGGNLAEVLDTVGHTIRERNAIRRQVKALSAEGRLSAYVLMALPIGLFLFLMAIRPEYMGRLTQTPIGWAMLGGAVLLLTGGGFWLRQTVRITF